MSDNESQEKGKESLGHIQEHGNEILFYLARNLDNLDASSVSELRSVIYSLVTFLHDAADWENTRDLVRETLHNSVDWPCLVSRHPDSPNYVKKVADKLEKDYELGEALPVRFKGLQERTQLKREVAFNLFLTIRGRDKDAVPSIERRGRTRAEWMKSSEGKEWRSLMRQELEQSAGENWEGNFEGAGFEEFRREAEWDAKKNHLLSELTVKHFRTFILDRLVEQLHALAKD